jgi:cobalamin biosynthesis protein CobW
MTRVPVTVVTGFLGAGKTTLLRALLTRTQGRRIAVVVNEFGDAGFDGAMIGDCVDPACAHDDIVELTNGCICCTVADEFLPAMEKLLSRQPPLDAIVIETSGLALPQPLLKAFAWPSVKTRATVDGVVTVVDAVALAEGRLARDEAAIARQRAADASVVHDDPIDELFQDQLACADLVVLAKCDLVAPAALETAEKRLRAGMRPTVRIVRSHGNLDPAALIGLVAEAESDLAARTGHHDEHDEHDHDAFESFVVVPAATTAIETVRANVLAAMRRDGVLRIKGHVRVAGKPAPLVVQAVGGRISTAFARPDVAAAGLVVIGLKGFDGEAVRRILEA